MFQAIDALLSSCPDPIIEYSITIFGQKLNQVRGLVAYKRDCKVICFSGRSC